MATPTLIQHVTGPTVSNLGADSYKLQLPNPTLSGNCVIVAVTTGSSNTISVSDDKSNSYTSVTSVTGNQFCQVFTALNVTAGATVITCSFNATQNDVQALASEFNNIATSSAGDGSHTASGTATAVAAGSFTTTTAGDLIYHVGWQDSGGITTTSVTQGTSPFKLISVDLQNTGIGSMAAQYQIQASAGAINASYTQAPSAHFDTIAIALKNASAGSTPAAGIRIVSAYHSTINGSNTTPWKHQWPTTGNLLVAAILSIDAVTITSLTDGNSNTWTLAGTALSNPGSGQLRFAYVVGPTVSTTMTGPTVNFTGSNSSGDTIVFYDITGAATSPFDSTAGNPHATGTDSTTTAHNITTVSITPSTANGLIFSMFGLANPGPCDAVTPGTFMACTASPEANSGDMDENNGWGLEYNANTSSRTYLYHFPATGGGAGAWAASAVAFEAPAAGAGIPFEDESFNPSTQAVLIKQAEPVISVW